MTWPHQGFFILFAGWCFPFKYGNRQRLFAHFPEESNYGGKKYDQKLKTAVLLEYEALGKILDAHNLWQATSIGLETSGS